MSLSPLLDSLNERGVELWFEGDRLRFRAPKGALSAEQRAQLTAQRAAVVALLRSRAIATQATHPLSFSQRSLWFLHQQAPASTAYHVAMSARIRCSVDTQALGLAVQSLVDRHAILRTTYGFVEEAPCQRVAGAAVAAFTVKPIAGGEADLRQAVERAYRLPFDLEHGPVFRTDLFTRSEQDHVLLLTVHHIAADGWSLLLLLQELGKLYAEFAGGSAAGLSRCEVQYTDYSSWQEQVLAGAEGERLWSYWRGKLDHLPVPLELPAARPRPTIQSFQGASVPLQFETDAIDRLRQLARAEGTTLFVVLLASFHAFLHRLTGADDLIVGTPTFGRSKAEFVNVIGDFVNSVPVRAQLDAKLSFRALVAQLRHSVIEALDAQEFPLPLLVQKLQPDRDASRSPLFDTFFLLQRFDQFRELQDLLVGNETNAGVDFGGLRLSGYPLDQQEGQFDLALQLVDGGKDIKGVLKYSTDLFDEATVRGFAADYLLLLKAIDADPDRALGTLPKPATGPAAPSAPVLALLAQLHDRDIRAFIDGERLRVNAPKGALTDELKALIAAHRDELTQALRASAAPPPPVNSQAKLLPIPRGAPLPVSTAQQRLWFLDRMDPGQSHYNIGVGVKIHGSLNVGSFSQAVDALIRRHESLHQRFGDVEGVPHVEILEPAGGALEYIDLAAMESQGRLAEAERIADERQRAPFDLARGPIARFVLIRLCEQEHWFAFSVHHAVSDGWSLILAVKEICALYTSLVSGRDSPLTALEVQYADYADWERRQLNLGSMAPHLNYWKRQLAGAPAVLELPTDRPRPAAQSFRGKRVRHYFEPSLLAKVKAVARQHDATLYMTLLAAWTVLLHRYSGQDDVVVGSPMANRDLPALEGLIGCFVNNVVLRNDLSGNPRFADLLNRVKQTVLGAFDHRDLPFDVLVEALRPVRSPSHAPVFQVLFALQSFPTEVKAPPGLSLEMVEPQTGASRFDLTLELVDYQGRFGALYEYASDLFDEATITRLHGHMERLLGSIVNDPSAKIQDLPLITTQDEQVLLRTWNDTAVAHDRGRCVHHLLQAAALAAPDAVALIADAQRLSFGELERRANQLAHLLIDRGVRPGDLVAICVERGIDMPIAMAAVLKTGAAYVPLDPSHPADRLQYSLHDAGVACVITQSAFVTLLTAGQAPLVVLDEVTAEWAKMSPAAVRVTVLPEDLAYVIYTSGSTGRPKGVQVEHRNVVNFLEAMRRTPGFTARDVLLAVTTLSFDIAGLEIWLPLVTGGTSVIASRGEVLDGERLMALLQEHQVTVMQATPATWRVMLEAGWTGKSDLRVLCGGEALPRDLAGSLIPKVAQLWNMYGPTETTIWSTLSRVSDVGAPVTIGKPIANTTVYVLEPSGQPAPIGVPGELCIGGEGVARGYRNRPELTAEKFVTLTVAGGRTERVYRTGDLARFRAEGNLEFIGRRDHQVKVRGYRIELGEIESVLSTHAGVKECVVVVREDSSGDQRLVGYVVSTVGSSFEVEAARATLRAKLPDYMLPNLFVELAALPLTPNGKIDRKALPAPQATQKTAPSAADLLMTPMQRRVGQIWQDVLHADRVGLHDNFFDLGGHSLLLVKLHAALKREFGGDIALVELFQRTTVAAQADRLGSAKGSDGALRRAQARAERQANAR